MKKQIAVMISIALISFLAGSLVNMNYIAMGNGDGNPWDRVWATISELQSAIDSLTASYDDLLNRVEKLEYPKDGHVAHWKFDEATGQIAYDASGNYNDGRVYGPSWTNGKLGGALDFDGVDDYVEVMHSPTLYFSSITVMAWVKFRTFPSYYGGVSMIVAKGRDDHQSGHFGLHQYFQGHSPGNPAIFHFYLTDNNQWYMVDGTTHIVLGEWYHVAGTYDGSALKIYVNGVLEDEEIINVTRTYNIENLQIGALRMTGWDYWTDGTIDEVKMYNRALTAQEVMQHYQQF